MSHEIDGSSFDAADSTFHDILEIICHTNSCWSVGNVRYTYLHA
jgi:hypothetical protein